MQGYFEPTGTYTHGSLDSDGTYQRTPLFSFACKRRNASKCQNLGYVLDEPIDRSVPPDRKGGLFESCVRMMRADYCGNGYSFTKDGVAVRVWDNAGVISEANPPVMRNGGASPHIHASAGSLVSAADGNDPFAFEAAWGPSGARCVSGVYRIAEPDMTRYQRRNWLLCKDELQQKGISVCETPEEAYEVVDGETSVFNTCHPPESPPAAAASAQKLR
jgi:hypothetical protein